MSELIKQATTPRPSKDRLDEEAKEALCSYFAGRTLYEYIYPFSRLENKEKLEYRRQQTVKHYDNFPQEIARKYVEGIFRTDKINRVFDDERFDAYLKGDYAKWFKKDFALFALLLPEIWVIVSNPSTELEIKTRADEIELGLMPYPAIIYPQHIQNFCIDREGKCEWVSVKDGDEFKLYTETEVITIDKDGNASAAIPHGWPECPIVRIAWQENTSEGNCKRGHAFLKTVIDLSIANLQYTSMLVEMGYFHLSYKLVMGEETASATIGSGLGNQTAIVETEREKGTTRYLELPSVEMGELKDIVYNRNPKRIYEAARLTDRTGTVAQSGVAKSIDMLPEVAALTEIAEFLQSADRKILELLAMGWLTGGNKKLSLQYPVVFSSRSTDEVIKEFTSLTDAANKSSLPFSQSFLIEMVKRAQRAMMPDADADILKQMDSEVEKAAENAEKKLDPAKPTMPQAKTEAPQQEPMMDQADTNSMPIQQMKKNKKMKEAR